MKNLIKKLANFPFYISLIFFAFPITYVLDGSYPKYTLLLTLPAIICYISMIYANNKYISFILWFYLSCYIIYMTIWIHPMNMLFSFYLSNLIVWHFKDISFRSYRITSFFTILNFLIIAILFGNYRIPEKFIMSCFYVLCLATFIFQRKAYFDKKLKEEHRKHNEHINILLAENERNRISRDLHDSIGHVFVMLKLKAELAEKLLIKNKLEEAQNELREIIEISTKSMHETRSIINNLKYRTINEELKIIEDITSLAEIKCKIENNIYTKELSSWTTTTTTMILKELINNIIKHSNADNCSLILNEKQNDITIISTDNGVGFKEITGNELKSIYERIKIVNGTITIISKNNPTKIQVIIPKKL
ncbi:MULTISPECIES: sensor histidine kinase [Gemella]|uniref:sensor histidine kinase n=1 Tax=Gemella TaxID=1378 RepID=UPI0007683CCA|nr:MULTISPECIES: sensor histidine kinase [Gemella]AME09952.1 histidine kinase [Gemella sp. oral taxon 928]AXI26092.1 sensor histidine kinase [Gemella sp. ND 6198]